LNLLLDRMQSPLGVILLVHDAGGSLRSLDFEDFEVRMRQLLRLHYGRVELAAAPAPDAVTAPLHAYFAGSYGALESVPTETAGTPFQRSVWAALRMIPPGSTVSYGALASTIGRPGAFRAVGLANGANPLTIVVPCHRVIGAGRALTGFGGGLHRKRWLLEHEGVLVEDGQRAMI
jgi:methylated-DNA-[protein]-cysteine S-methyltransferase